MYDVLQKLLDERGITATDVARETGISRSSMTDWKKGRSTPKYEKRKKIADMFGVTVDYLDGVSPFPYGEEKNFEVCSESSTVTIPILGRVPAGIPIEAVTDRIGEIEIASPRGDDKYWALKVKGDSMYPKILDGDIVIFREQQSCENGDICVVRVNGTDATLKKVVKNGDSIILQPLNPDFEPLVFSDSVVDQPSLEVIGVAKEIRREL